MSLRPDYKTFFNVSPNAYVLLNPEFTIVAVNEAYLEMTGRTREELVGRDIFDAFPGKPEEQEDPNARRFRAAYERVLSTGERDFLALIPYTIPLETAEGETVHEERYWSVTLTPIFNEDEEVVFILQHPADVTELYETKQQLQAVEEQRASGHFRTQVDRSSNGEEEHDAQRDPDEEERERGPESEEDGFISRRQAEDIPFPQLEGSVFNRAEEVQKAYWASEKEREHLQRLFEQAPGFMTFLRGPAHVFEMANEAYYQVVGHRDILGKPVREALPEVEGQGFFRLLDRVYESGEPFVGREVEVRLQRTPDEELETVYLDFIYQPVTRPDGSVAGIFVQGHDVTEKKQTKDRLRRQRTELKELNETLEERVERRTQQVRELTSRVTMAEQRERRRIARVLHDDLQQRLYGIQLQMSSLRDRRKDEGDDEAEGALEELERQMDEAIQMARRLSVGMSPPVLQSEGLKAALEWLQSHMKETRGLDVSLSADGEFLMEEEMRVLLFQITRELLVNVSEHAGVDRATIELFRKDEELHIRVIDEGKGFRPEEVQRHIPEEGFGLIAARERIRPFGGELEIQAAPGEGAQVTVRLPVEEPSTH